MRGFKDNQKDLNTVPLLEHFFQKYIKVNFVYEPDNLITNDNVEDLTCPICFYILNNPKSCSVEQNSHSFCQRCIDNYLKQNDKCPTCKLFFKYEIKNEIKNKLTKLSFKCINN